MTSLEEVEALTDRARDTIVDDIENEISMLQDELKMDLEDLGDSASEAEKEAILKKFMEKVLENALQTMRTCYLTLREDRGAHGVVWSNENVTDRHARRQPSHGLRSLSSVVVVVVVNITIMISKICPP